MLPRTIASPPHGSVLWYGESLRIGLPSEFLDRSTANRERSHRCNGDRAGEESRITTPAGMNPKSLQEATFAFIGHLPVLNIERRPCVLRPYAVKNEVPQPVNTLLRQLLVSVSPVR